MLNKDRWTYWRRVVIVIGLAVATVVALTAPAFAHPVFSNDGPGFPNPMGGNGGPGQTPPYPAGSRPTLNMHLPFEQDGVVFNGAENTTVDVRVTIPTAWANPACGAVRTLSTDGYRQMGTVVPGWACAVETVSGHQVLHWSGPQISSKQSHDDSAQFFTFQATMPAPAATTSYGAKDGPEGVHVKQVYASGATSLWAPPNDPAGGEIANGVVRTVARAPAPAPTAAPTPAPTRVPTQGGTTQEGAIQGAGRSTRPPQAQQGGGDPATPPAAGLPLAGPTTPVSPPSADAQSSPGAAPTESPPATDLPPQSVEQLTQQRDNATQQGSGWGVWAAVVLGVLLVAGAVIAGIKRRRRTS